MADNGKDLTVASKDTIRVVVTLTGEAALRLQMYADGIHVHKNVAARMMLVDGMKENGLLLKSYEYVHPGK